MKKCQALTIEYNEPSSRNYQDIVSLVSSAITYMHTHAHAHTCTCTHTHFYIAEYFIMNYRHHIISSKTSSACIFNRILKEFFGISKVPLSHLIKLTIVPSCNIYACSNFSSCPTNIFFRLGCLNRDPHNVHRLHLDDKSLKSLLMYKSLLSKICDF